MSSILEIRDGQIHIEIERLVGLLTDDEKCELRAMLVCDEALIETVVNHLASLHEWNDTRLPAIEQPLRERIAALMPEIVRETVKNLIWERDSALAEAKRQTEFAYRLLRWARERTGDIPDWQRFEPTPFPAPAEIEAVLGPEALQVLYGEVPA